MQQSTIYIKCPQCGENGLLTHLQGKYLCANCMYDYTRLKDDPGKLDSVLLETIKQKGFGPVFASTLYQRVMLKPSPESASYVQQLAEKNGIDIYQGHRTFVKIIDWLIKLFKK
jgi:NMD protein affecting ribosome stability and mRNA decay